MIIVDRAMERRASAGNPVRVGVFGAGFMSRGLFNQQQYTNGWSVAAVCNRTPDHAVRALRDAGVTDVEVVENQTGFDTVVARGGTAVTPDPELLCASEAIECVVEATGHVGYGARVTVLAIEHGKHVVLMNAELDGTVGSLLHAKGRDAGVIVTGCDGDQPGVELNLYRFVTSIGLEPLVCGNIKGMQDRYRTPETQASFAAQWGQTPEMVTSFADGTKISFEQAIVANATGMSVAQRGMIGIEYDGHVDDLVDRFDVDDLRARGGIVDYVVGSQPSPGVFVYAAAHDDLQRKYLDYGKLGSGPLYSFYVPYHLTIFEVPFSVVRAVDFDDAVIQPLRGPCVDVVAVAKRALEAGETIDGLGGFMTYGVCENRDTAMGERLLPMGLAEGCTLRRAVARDSIVTLDDVEFPDSSLVHDLWIEQNTRFPVVTR